jgi:hypothetical protein
MIIIIIIINSFYTRQSQEAKAYTSTMLTSTSTPGSMEMDVIDLTTSVGALRSISLLWIRISKRSHVLDPSPLGVFLVVMRSVFVGILTGPLALRLLERAPSNRSLQVFSRAATFLLVRVILILWTCGASASSTPALGLVAIAADILQGDEEGH